MPTGFANIEKLTKQARAVALPPVAPISHAEFCRTIRIAEGPHRGSLYIPETDPAHACISREINAGGWQRIIAVGAVQTGKSLSVVLVPLLRSLTALRQPCVYSQPTLTKLQEGWAGKLSPSMTDSGYGGWLPDKGQGSKGSQTPKFVTFREPKTRARAGTLYLIPGGGSSESAQAAVTAAVVVVDEVDSFPSRHRVELVLKRADSYGPHALRILTSTVKSDEVTGDGASIILSFYRESTSSRLHFKCPHCGHWQRLEWERVSYLDGNEPEAIASARYTCEGCAVAWTEDDRQRALKDWRCVHAGQQIDQATGTVIGQAPQTVAFGLLWTALDSSLRSLGQLAAEHWRATRAAAVMDFGPMRSFHRDQLCRPFAEPEPEGEFCEKSIADNSSRSTYEKRMVPAWAHFLTVTQDVQGDRHYWLCVAHGEGDRWAIVDWGFELLVEYENGKASRAPTPADRVRVFDLIRDRAAEGWQIQDSEQVMRPVMRGVDCGYLPEEVVSWVQGNPKWKALRGVGLDQIKHQSGGHEKLLPKEIRQTNAIQAVRPPGWKVYWWKIDGPRFRRSFQSALMRHPDQPASGMLPRGVKANTDLAMHLAGMKFMEPEGKKAYWFEKRKRHDYGDCLEYGLALAMLHRHAPDDRGEETPAGETDTHQPPQQSGGSSSWVESSYDAPNGGGWLNG